MLIMTRNMVASEGGCGFSLIFKDFSKLSSSFSTACELEAVPEYKAACFLAATRRSSSSSSFKSISIPFTQNESGTF